MKNRTERNTAIIVTIFQWLDLVFHEHYAKRIFFSNVNVNKYQRGRFLLFTRLQRRTCLSVYFQSCKLYGRIQIQENINETKNERSRCNGHHWTMDIEQWALSSSVQQGLFQSHTERRGGLLDISAHVGRRGNV
jgi:hypothetical protein